MDFKWVDLSFLAQGVPFVAKKTKIAIICAGGWVGGGGGGKTLFGPNGRPGAGQGMVFRVICLKQAVVLEMVRANILCECLNTWQCRVPPPPAVIAKESHSKIWPLSIGKRILKRFSRNRIS